MSNPPQMHVPPTPASPGRPPARHGALIALLVLALVVICAAAALIYGVRIISQNVSVHKEAGNAVSIQTPVGNLAVRQGAQADPALIGLPVYPGARRVRDNRGGATVQMSFPDQRGGGVEVGVMAAKFESTDPLDKVSAYYRDQLGDQITKIKHGDFGHEITFEMDHGGIERVVGLKSNENGTQITLVRVRHGSEQAN